VDVSICVATYRRPEGLARLLASLGRMKLPEGLRLELLVVDNDPQAPEEAALPDAGGLPARRLREPQRNIACARNRALQAACGDWVAFVDDDEVVHEQWLAAFVAQAGRTPCDGLFGPVLARAEWPEAGGLAWLAIFTRERFASGARVPLAAARTGNAFLRRRLFDGVVFEPAFGRSGGSDTQLFARLLARGADFRWCDEAQVEEWLPPERLRARWLLRRAFRGGNLHGRLARRAPPARVALAALRAAAGLCAAAALLPFGAAAGRLGALRAAMRVASAAGRIHGLLGGHVQGYPS
jgi:glycosyltransferase involved in cell wall biosynthesis